MVQHSYAFPIAEGLIDDRGFLDQLARADAAGQAIERGLKIVEGSLTWYVETGLEQTLLRISFEGKPDP